MGQGIHARRCCQGRGHPHHQKGVINGHIWGDAPVHDGHFDLAARVGDDTKAGHFTSRAGCCVYSDKRRHSIFRLVDSFVVADMATIGGNDPDALSAVVGTATTEGNNEVAVLGLVNLKAFVNIVVCGVWLGAVVYNWINIAFGLDHRCNLIRDASVRNSLVSANKGSRTAEYFDLVTNLFVCPHTHQGDGGDVESKYLFLNGHVILLKNK